MSLNIGHHTRSNQELNHHRLRGIVEYDRMPSFEYLFLSVLADERSNVDVERRELTGSRRHVLVCLVRRGAIAIRTGRGHSGEVAERV